MSDYDKPAILLAKSSPTYAADKPIELSRAWCIIWELVDRIAEMDAENAELRKQNDILATARRLEEAERRQAEAAISDN